MWKEKRNESSKKKKTPQNAPELFWALFPKDPAVLKTLRDCELLRRSAFTTPPYLLLRCEPFFERRAPCKTKEKLSARGSRLSSGKKKQHKHKLFGLDFPRTFLTLTPGRPWVKKFLPITVAAEKRTFWCGRPRFLARTSMTRRVLEKLCTKKFALIFWPLLVNHRAIANSLCRVNLPLGTKLLHTVFYVLGNYFR